MDLLQFHTIGSNCIGSEAVAANVTLHQHLCHCGGGATSLFDPVTKTYLMSWHVTFKMFRVALQLPLLDRHLRHRLVKNYYCSSSIITISWVTFNPVDGWLRIIGT
jgi:hypothetical protein